MTRGFEHRLWGYTLVRIRQEDAERGLKSDSTSFPRPTSSTTSLELQEMELETVGYPEEGHRAAQRDEHAHQVKDKYSNCGDGDLAIISFSESRDGSEETDECERVGEWQIPRTVLLTSGSIGPF